MFSKEKKYSYAVMFQAESFKGVCNISSNVKLDTWESVCSTSETVAAEYGCGKVVITNWKRLKGDE